MTVTAHQERILETIASFTDEHGFPPTTRELADALGVLPSSVHGSLTRLRELRKVDWDDGRARTLRIVEG